MKKWIWREHACGWHTTGLCVFIATSVLSSGSLSFLTPNTDHRLVYVGKESQNTQACWTFYPTRNFSLIRKWKGPIELVETPIADEWNFIGNLCWQAYIGTCFQCAMYLGRTLGKPKAMENQNLPQLIHKR